MNEVRIFESPIFGKIRTAGTGDNPLFCLTDVCKTLGLQVIPTKYRLNPDGIDLIKVIDSRGCEKKAIFINEENLYKTVLRSDKPMAEPFLNWVYEELKKRDVEGGKGDGNI